MLNTSTASEPSGGSADRHAAKPLEPELRLLLAFTPIEGSRDTLEVIAQPVTINPGEGGKLEVRNLDTVGFNTHPLADLQIRALADRPQHDSESHLWSVQYRDCFAIDLRRVEMMHKTLKRVDRALEKVHTELGPPETFAAYLARCAVALRISTFGFRTGPDTGWHPSNEYQWMDAAGMVYRIAEHLADWRAQNA
jgi:hypothetical protein